MKTIPREQILRLNCPGFGEENNLSVGRARPLDQYQAIVCNPVSIIHLFDKDPDLVKQVEQALTDGLTSYSIHNDPLLQALAVDIETRLFELVKFLENGGILVYFLCRPFLLQSDTLAMDNYYWLESLAPDAPKADEKNVRHMSAVSHGRIIEPTDECEASEMAPYFQQAGLEWNTIIRTDFLTDGYTVLATAGAKKCISGHLHAGDAGGRLVFLPAPYSPDFDRILMDCLNKCFAGREGGSEFAEQAPTPIPVAKPELQVPVSDPVSAAVADILATPPTPPPQPVPQAPPPSLQLAPPAPPPAPAPAPAPASAPSSPAAELLKSLEDPSLATSDSLSVPEQAKASNDFDLSGFAEAARQLVAQTTPAAPSAPPPPPAPAPPAPPPTPVPPPAPPPAPPAAPVPPPAPPAAPTPPPAPPAAPTPPPAPPAAPTPPPAPPAPPAPPPSPTPPPAPPAAPTPPPALPPSPTPPPAPPAAPTPPPAPPAPTPPPAPPPPAPTPPPAPPPSPVPMAPTAEAEPAEPTTTPKAEDSQMEVEQRQEEQAQPMPTAQPKSTAGMLDALKQRVDGPREPSQPLEHAQPHVSITHENNNHEDHHDHHDQHDPGAPDAKDLIRRMEQASNSPIPDWCWQFSFPFVEDLKREKAGINDQLRQMQIKLSTVDNRIAAVEGIKVALLAAEGEELLSTCNRVLNRIGWNSKPSTNNKEELVLSSVDNAEAIVRIVRSPAMASRSEVALLAESVISYWDEHEVEPKGILLACTHVNQAPEDRNDPDFSDALAEFAAKKHLCLMTTLQLLSMYKDVELGVLQGDQLRKHMLECNGRLTGYQLEGGVVKQPVAVE